MSQRSSCDERDLLDHLLQQRFFFVGQELREEEIDSGLFKRVAEPQDKHQFTLIEIVPVLIQGSHQVVTCNRPKIKVGHCLFRQTAKDVHSNLVGAVIHAD